MRYIISIVIFPLVLSCSLSSEDKNDGSTSVHNGENGTENAGSDDDAETDNDDVAGGDIEEDSDSDDGDNGSVSGDVDTNDDEDEGKGGDTGVTDNCTSERIEKYGPDYCASSYDGEIPDGGFCDPEIVRKDIERQLDYFLGSDRESDMPSNCGIEHGEPAFVTYSFCRRDISDCCSIELQAYEYDGPWFFCSGDWLPAKKCLDVGEIKTTKPNIFNPTGEIVCVAKEHLENVKRCPLFTKDIFCVSDDDCSNLCREIVNWEWKCCHAEYSDLRCRYEEEADYQDALTACDYAKCDRNFSNGLYCDVEIFP